MGKDLETSIQDWLGKMKDYNDDEEEPKKEDKDDNQGR